MRYLGSDTAEGLSNLSKDISLAARNALLEMVDYIIWDEADPTNLGDAPRQLGALIDWVRQGGCLVLAAAQTCNGSE